MQTVPTDCHEGRAQRSQDDGGATLKEQPPGEPVRALQGTKPIYPALADHQITDESWELRELLEWLCLWKDRMVFEFKLGLSEVALCVDWLHWRRYGHFRRGHNGFGLVAEIAINRRYLDYCEPWGILGTLCHELLHAWQHVHGKTGRANYHNKQFRDKAARLGLIIDERGVTQYAPEDESPFKQLLRKCGVTFPNLPVLENRRSKTKLKKWLCACDPRINGHRPVSVRVAVDDFHAKCMRCGKMFRRIP